MNVDEYFKRFASKLSITEFQQQKIIKTRRSIDAALESDDKIHLVKDSHISFLTGSYARKTIIRPIKDIDLYVRIHYGEHVKDQAPKVILKAMSLAIRRRYPARTKIGIDSPCVVVKFNNYKFEIVPASAYEDDNELFDIPSPNTNEWMQCYPNVPNNWMTNCNFRNDKMFIPIIKMLKKWNINHNVGLKSFHIELLSENVFSHVDTIINYPQGLYCWFDNVRSWIVENDNPFIPEPGSTGNFVDEYFYSYKPLRRKAIIRKFEIALRHAEEGLKFYLCDRHIRSKRSWITIFGSTFPRSI